MDIIKGRPLTRSCQYKMTAGPIIRKGPSTWREADGQAGEGIALDLRTRGDYA